MSASNLHLAWARLLFRGLAAAGVRHVVISPGSRSTPLVLAASDERELTCHTIIDERTAAFFALGQVRVTGVPTALLCTSGTAAAHYLPAIIEASESCLPLIVLTADRPWEAYDIASPQTIDQVKLYGHHVRHFAEIGVPDPSPAALRAVSRIAAQAVDFALHPVPGPVHLNARFRKPLEPVEVEGRESWQDDVDALIRQEAPARFATTLTIDERAVKELGRECLKVKRGLIACGPSAFPPDEELRPSVKVLALATGYPVFAEATSQVRFGPSSRDMVVVGAFDALLRSVAWAELPELIIELGSSPISGAYAAFIERHPKIPRWVVSEHGWHDPFNSASTVLHARPATFAQQVASWVTRDERSHEWAHRWAEADAQVWSRVEQEWAAPYLTEGAIACLLRAALPENACLVAGNSSPVRDLDTYAPPGGNALRVLHQRGVSGIDGLVSGAAGVCSVEKGPVALYLGDVSLLHDIGGLLLARPALQPFVIVVVQNDGGRIFEQLPLGRRTEVADQLRQHFVTPHGLSFEHAAAMFGLRYRRAATNADFDAALKQGLDQSGCTLIEAIVPPSDGVDRRARLWRDVSSQLGGLS